MAATHGRQPSAAVSDPDAVRAATASQGGDATIAPMGLTFGRMVDGGRVGQFAAEYRKVAGTASATYAVPHGLGFVPAWCILIGCVEANGTPTVLSASWFEWEKWTASQVKVRVNADLGSRTGAVMWFIVGGER